MSVRAYEGPNGWYVAEELKDGSHHQPPVGPWLTERQARREARLANDPEARARVEQDYSERMDDWRRGAQ